MAKKVKKKKSRKKKGISSKPVGIRVEISIIEKAPKSREFILADGSRVRDMRELALTLGTMADDVFWHHVNDARNDFESWVNNVFKDKELAGIIKGVRDKMHMQTEILKHLVKKI